MSSTTYHNSSKALKIQIQNINIRLCENKFVNDAKNQSMYCQIWMQCNLTVYDETHVKTILRLECNEKSSVQWLYLRKKTSVRERTGFSRTLNTPSQLVKTTDFVNISLIDFLRTKVYYRCPGLVLHARITRNNYLVMSLGVP